MLDAAFRLQILVCSMRAVKLLVGSELAVLAIFFFEKVLSLGGHTALGVFELCSAGVSLYLLSKARLANASPLDWIVCAILILIACIDLASISITLFAFYLMIRAGHDLNARAAGTVAIALSVQAVWAPLAFAKLSFLFLQIDAGVVGWLVSHFVPGASWGGTVVSTPSGHNVEIYAPCASFHNISLASLCWVTLTMLHRPYWVKSDLYVGLLAAGIQFGCNICRLVFVCLSLSMYQFWHEGLGMHIFSAVATASAIILVQLWLLRFDRHERKEVAFANSTS